MRKVKFEALRLSSVTGGRDNFYHKSRYNQESHELQRFPSQSIRHQGLLSLVFYARPTSGQSMIGKCVYFVIWQRFKLRPVVVRRLRKREGALAGFKVRHGMLTHAKMETAPARHYVDYTFDKIFPEPPADPEFDKQNAKSSQRFGAMVKNSGRGRNFVVTSKDAKDVKPRPEKELAVAGKVRGGLDMERKFFFTRQSFAHMTYRVILRKVGDMCFPRSEFVAHPVTNYIRTLNPQRILTFYTFLRYNKRLYRDDLVRAIYTATEIGKAKALGYVISYGLQRHARKRKQVFYRKFVRHTMNYMRGSELVEEHVRLFLRVSGKFDAKVRAQGFYFKTERPIYQLRKAKYNIFRGTARTRFGTAGILLVIRSAG